MSRVRVISQTRVIPTHFDHRIHKASIEEIAEIAERKFGYRYLVSGNEGHGPCPFCGTGVDRFVLFDDGGYWCRQCRSSGFVESGFVNPESGFVNSDNNCKTVTQAELLERRVAALEHEQKKTDKRLDALEAISRRLCDVEEYHANLNEAAVDWWHDAQGVSYRSIHKYQLGYCTSCPTAPNNESYTIPYFDPAGNLINIRHRLKVPQSGKYRPHMAGLGISLFQEKTLSESDDILLLEGEVKTIILGQNGFPAVGVMGCKSFKKKWVKKFRGKQVIIAMDPDAMDSARQLGYKLRDEAEVRIASFPVKPDDMIVKYGGTIEDVQSFLQQARPV